MKFEYDKTDDNHEVVALIHNNDCLIIKTEKGYIIFGTDDEKFETVDTGEWDVWIKNKNTLVKKYFYKGDSVTITF